MKSKINIYKRISISTLDSLILFFLICFLLSFLNEIVTTGDAFAELPQRDSFNGANVFLNFFHYKFYALTLAILNFLYEAFTGYRLLFRKQI